MTIMYNYLWYHHLDGDAEENYQTLCSVFDWDDVHSFVEKSVGGTFTDEDEAYDACNELLHGDVGELGERIADMFNITMTDEIRESLGLIRVDDNGRRYRVVPEQPSQMFLFPVENPVRRVYQ